MNKYDLLEIFEYLNERLKENKLILEIAMYGGSIMTLLYDNRPATRDIDCVFGSTNEILLNEVLKITGKVFGLEDGWINEEIKVPLKALIKEDLIEYKTYSNLIINRPIKKQLLAMKILASRPEPSKDFIDAYILCRDLNVKTRKELIEIVKQYIPLKLLGERQNKFIEYLGEDLGYDWE